MNRAAQKLGRRARGVPKQFTPEEIEERKARPSIARGKRWLKADLHPSPLNGEKGQ